MLQFPESHPSLRIDDVFHELGDIAVLRRGDSLPGGIPWSMQFEGDAARQFLKLIPRLRAGRPSPALAADILAALRNMLRLERRHARFVIATVDRIATNEGTFRLTGRCSPLLLEALAPGGRSRRYGDDPKS